MATAIYSSLIDHSPLDGTNDAINGAEVDANPYTLAQILDGTTATDLGQEGAIDFRFTSSRAGIRAIDLDNAGAAVHYGLVIEWDPGDGANLTDGSSGIGIQYIMPDDADTQTVYARHYVLMVNDAAAADAAEVVWETAVGGTLTVETLRYGASGLFWNDDGNAALDIRFETDNFANAFIMDAGLDVFAFGGAAVDDTFLGITPPARTSTATTNTYHMNIAAGGAVTIPAGTTTYVGSLNIEEPNITATGTVTNAFTVRIAGAPTEGGTTNYALWVDDGAVKFDGTLEVTGALTFTGALAVDDTTDTTSATTGSIQTDGGLGIVKALWVGTTSRLVGVTTHGGNVVSDTDSTDDLGTTSVRWANVYTDSIGDTGQDLTVAATTINLPSGHIFDYNGADVTLTHAANTLTWAGATSGYIFNDGNVGIGVTPATWLAGVTALQVGGTGAFQSSTAAGANAQNNIMQNAVVAADASFDYIVTDEASRYQQVDGTHVWYSAVSGTAGNDITWITDLQITNAGAIKNPLDSQGFYTGAGDDLRIYHDGTNSLITNSTGSLLISSAIEVGGTVTPLSGAPAIEATGTLYIASAIPAITLDETDAGANTRAWDFLANAGTLTGRVTNDAVSASEDWIQVVRSAATISSVTFPNGYVVVSEGVEIGTASTNNLIDDASNGAGSTTLYIGNASINVTSDRRAKFDIEDFSGSALDLLSHARVVSFNYDPIAINDESAYGPSSRGRYVGMIAQEMREWAPWAINAGDGVERDDFMWQAEYEHIVPLLVAAVNELREENTKMKARLN